MSIWSSVGEPIAVLNGNDEDANYRAQGEPSAFVDVATTRSYHDHIRLAMWDDTEHCEMTAVLSPAAASELRDRLAAALAEGT